MARPDEDLERLTARFEIAVANFVRSTYDLSANEKAFQAWYAASVIQEFGLSRVYREIHLLKSELAALVGPEAFTGFHRGNELFPDLSVSWTEAIDARHSVARGPALDAGAMLASLGIVSEFKVTSSTTTSTPPSAIRRDIRKLGVFAFAHARATEGAQQMATYMVILDNHRREDDTPTGRYTPERTERMLDRMAETWPAAAPSPVVLVGGLRDGEPVVSRHVVPVRSESI